MIPFQQFKTKTKKNGYGNNFEAYLVLENIMEQKFSIFDTKFTISEDFFRYVEFSHPKKLHSGGMREYLNIQGMRLTSGNHQTFYTKNVIKYESLFLQKQMIRKMFSNSEGILDKQNLVKLKMDISNLVNSLKKYGVAFEGSSMLVLYCSLSRTLKLKFLDFSYMPHSCESKDFLGAEIFLKVLDKFSN